MATPAPCLVVLRDEVNKEHPGRDKSSDGWIGNTAHAATGSPEAGGSKHNANHRGVVDARDFDNTGVDVPRFVAAAIAHPSTDNIIYNRKIRSRSAGLHRVFAYHGPSPHTEHVHVDVIMTPERENDRRAWGYYRGGKPVTPAKPAGGGAKGGMTRMPVLRRNPALVAAAVKTAQRTLVRVGFGVGSAGADGRFGDGTRAAVVRFQQTNHLSADGVIGPVTWIALAQALLNKVAGSKLKVDGDFGPATSAAVVAYQKNHGLVADGIVGPKTWTRLLVTR